MDNASDIMMFATRLGVVTKNGLLLVAYNSKTVLQFDQIKNLTLHKKTTRFFEYAGYLTALFLVSFSYFLYTQWLFFSCSILAAGVVFFVSRYFRIKKYTLVLLLVSGDHFKIKVQKNEILDAKRLIKHYRKKSNN